MTEDKFKELLFEKHQVKLTDDFDKNMMNIINKHAIIKSKERKYFKLMYLYFIVGLAFGFLKTINFIGIDFSFGNYNILIDRLSLQIPIIIALLVIFERIIKATLVKNKKQEFSIV